MAAPVIPAISEWLWLVGIPSAHAATPHTMIATIAAARATSAASLLPPKSTMPKMVPATAVLIAVMPTKPIKLQTAAIIMAGVGRMARVPTTVAIAFGASVAPLTIVAPTHRTIIRRRTGFAPMAAATVASSRPITYPHLPRHTLLRIRNYGHNGKGALGPCKPIVKFLQK